MLQDRLLQILVVGVFFSSCSGATAPAAPSPLSLTSSHFPERVEGFWVDQNNPGYLLGFEEHRLLVADGGNLEVFRALGISNGQLRLCHSGREKVWSLRREGSILVLENPERGEVHRLRQLPEMPAELKLAPLEIPAPMALPEETVREVQKELAARLEEDQEFRRPIPRKKTFKESPPAPPWIEESPETDRSAGSGTTEMLMAARSSQSTEYILDLVRRIGWVDAKRFDYGTSNAAFLLVQHSWNLPLMLGALPWIEKDAQEGRIGKELYALLFDRVQLSLGERQRYGTQVIREEAEVIVLPVENPERVDELRKEAGMLPLERYVKLFGGAEVRFSTECKDN